MADVVENAPFTDPVAAISQGKRHLLVRDHSMAVAALAQACELLAEKHGDTADELAEPYLLYGRALLGLAREEAGVLGGGVPGSEGAETEEDVGEECEDEKPEEEEGEEDQNSETASENKKSDVDADSTTKPDNAKTEEKEEKRATEEKKSESAANASEKKTEESPKPSDEPNKTDDSKIADGKGEKSAEKPDSTDSEMKEVSSEKKESSTEQPEATATSSSLAEPTVNGGSVADPDKPEVGSSEVQQNGVASEDGGEEEGEDVNKEDEEDEVNNLQLAWEVLELAKLVLLKRGPPGWKHLAEAHRLLGEVAMEGGNHQGAVADLEACLNLFSKIEPCEPRAIAEIHYQLGLAYSLGNEFDESIAQFKEATVLLEARIKDLLEMKEAPKSDDPFYTLEGEIKELKELLPEIQEKIVDMKDFKEEACKAMIEGIKSKVAEGCANGAGTSSDGAGSSAAGTSSSGSGTAAPRPSKPASDISHLVRKKRKAEEVESSDVATTPSKKPTP